MSLLRLYPLMSFALVLLAIVAQCLSQRHPWLLLLAGGLAALSRTVSEGPRGVALPRAISLMLTAIALVWAAVVATGDLSQPIPAIGQFVVWLTVIKLYERHTLENEAERLILALLLMVLASLISIDLIFGLLLLLWSGLGLVTLMLFQLHCAAESMQRQRSKVLGVLPGGSPNPVFGPGVRRHYRNFSIMSVILVFAVATSAFLLFPRGLTSGLSNAAMNTLGHRQVGLGEGVDLLGSTRISLSREQVLSVGVTDSAGESVHLNHPLRLRAAVLSAYRGDGIWGTEPIDMDTIELQDGLRRTLFYTPEGTELLKQNIQLDMASEQIVSMSVPVAITVDTDTTLAFRSASQTMRVAHDAPSPMQYDIDVVPEPPLYRTPLAIGVAPDIDMVHPYANSSVHHLAVELLQNAGHATSPPENPKSRLEWYRNAATTFERYLKYGSFRYTLDLSEVGIDPATADIDPVERFLLHEPYGHCEYFAASMTGLCHSVQVPARLVTGYVSNRFDELSQRYVVTKSDAHAWTEVLGPGPKWLVFDPTPPANVPGTREAAMGPIDQVIWFWRWLEGQWRFNVLGFDTETQTELAESFLPSLQRDLDASLKTIGGWAQRFQKLIGLGEWFSVVIIVLVALVTMSIVIMFRGQRRRCQNILEQTQCVHVTGREGRLLAARLGFYVDMLERLKLAGLSKPQWQPPAAYAQSLVTVHPAVSKIVREITRGFYQIRFGGLIAGEREALQMKDALERLDQALEDPR
ncbi:MAG: transglutaminaseTgpA domain-containing protein [Planctomycetota bacterium]|nr:transglutaminaseTgpA domain-containing protein [Planctomycetota bacterium]